MSPANASMCTGKADFHDMPIYPVAAAKTAAAEARKAVKAGNRAKAKLAKASKAISASCSKEATLRT